MAVRVHGLVSLSRLLARPTVNAAKPISSEGRHPTLSFGRVLPHRARRERWRCSSALTADGAQFFVHLLFFILDHEFC